MTPWECYYCDKIKHEEAEKETVTLIRSEYAKELREKFHEYSINTHALMSYSEICKILDNI